MKGNFCYCNPTKIYFGCDATKSLRGELERYGEKVLVIYGGGSIKRTGVYDEIMGILKEAGKRVEEFGGVLPNPTSDTLRAAAKKARDFGADLILAVGGGSVCDLAKAAAVSAYCDEDPWERYYEKDLEPECETIPLGCVLTMAGTGSEMNGGAVITDEKTKMKMGHVFVSEHYPRFSILNPSYTLTVSSYQMASGIFDIMSHILEQYLSGDDDNTSDYVAEGLMRSLIHSSRIAAKNPQDLEARSNIMWTASLALNTVTACGKSTDWEVHMIGQAIGAHTNAAHGMTLSAVTMAYFRHILPYGLQKFRRLAVSVWGVDEKNKTDEEIASEGLRRMEDWMREIGGSMSARDVCVT